MEKKTLTIIDFFRTEDREEEIFIENCKRLKKSGRKILLITGGSISQKMQEEIDYCFYNSENQLFEYEGYNYFHPFHLKTFNDGHIHTLKTFSVQRHGLAFILNIFNSVKIAKSLGFKYFERILWDVLPGEKSCSWMDQVSNICQEKDKKAFFYYNEMNIFDSKSYPDINGNYFFSDIEFFLQKIPSFIDELGYREVLLNFFSNEDFLITEKFIYEFLKDDPQVYFRSSDNLSLDFSDAERKNSYSISDLNFPKKFGGVFINLTRVIDSEDIVLYLKSFAKTDKKREIVISFNDGSVQELERIISPNTWEFLFLNHGVQEITVYEHGKLIHSEKVGKSQNTIQFI